MSDYSKKERTRHWPVPSELMAQYNDGSHNKKDMYGNLFWYQNHDLHRDGDKPAVIFADGRLIWAQNARRHRHDDKPAYIGLNGILSWYQNGKQHRFSGPSVIWANNHQFDWYINGENITCEVNAWLNGKRWRGTPLQIFEFQLRFG